MAFFNFASDAEQRLTCQSGRVLLRPARFNDHSAWATLREESRAFLVPWEPAWKTEDLTRGHFREKVKRSTKEIAADAAYPLLVFRTNDQALMGSITIGLVRRGVSQTATLGYWIGAAFARQGYMSEAIAAVFDLSFGTLGLRRLEAACLARNAASVALLRRSGFQSEGLARQYLKINGIWEDHLLYARLASDPAPRVPSGNTGILA
jgi:[ribosomal protein S5]-alanine N-acetyltransferase